MQSETTPDRSRVHSPLLATLARRIRNLRRGRSWTRDELARRSGLSVRFLARVESGEGNISVLRLEALAHALGTGPDVLLGPEFGPAPIIALVGLRGAGKSTVGPLLARELGLPFAEMDDRIIEASGLPIDQIFELHGASYYRKLERETLRRLIDGGTATVLAAAGGVVNTPESWNMLCERTTVVWLRARPEEHWSRVVAQGDRRPMEDNPEAMEQLRELLRARERVYSEARFTVQTSGIAPRETAARIAGMLSEAPTW